MRAQVSLSRTALLGNFKILAKKAPGQLLLPMVKANAYGHDAKWVANVLLSDPSVKKRLFGFGVATFDEAISLRSALPKSTRTIPILVFSDCAPYLPSWAKLCTRHGLEPVLGDLTTILQFQKRHPKIPFHVEVNTGMNRLGIPVDSLKLLQVKPRSVFTHLAEAEDPRSSLTLTQKNAFEKVILWKKQSAPGTLIHFANSAAIWNSKHFPFFPEMDLVRPGLSLYGIRPFAPAKNDGLKPVMTFSAPVIQKTFLEKGDRVGYNGIYRAKKPEWVATLAAGYADGVFRALGNRKNILGKVSMDLSVVKASSKTKLGDWIPLWGGTIDPYDVAARANTNPYEIVTRLGERVKKIYG